MGGETSAIQRVANKVSDEIFDVFKWKRSLREDMNWTCCLEGHAKKTHPSDVVFHYIDPYEEEAVYLNTDLKSYAKGTIDKASVEVALTSLALAVECANSSDEWRTKYVVDESYGYNVRGLLFLYNHDNLYDKDFYSAVTSKLDLNKIKNSKNTKIHFLDPYKISDIINISNDLKTLIGSGQLPPPDLFSFYYPDMDLTRIKHPINKNTVATIELLTSPYIIIKHESFKWINTRKESGYTIYYNQPGDSQDEFVYFLDMLSKYQILTENKLINIRIAHMNACENALHHFEKAKKKYSYNWLSGEEERIFSNVKIEFINKTIMNFNLESIGMEQR
ncbi:hypothetical protein REJ26_000421 [Providencia stuartii]|uniref:hypothetical protein n=1 Tax=Providencia TaxID=586 RepID=UPI0027F590F6|nr:hypothetical protein [Providencia sp. 2023EL-00965]ELR5298702.1 hypothetical protein [Providencia stuartii]MDW7587154.1 hypothetical protein [Providencia sp. 2023EL-00965]